MWSRVLKRVKIGLAIWGKPVGHTSGKEMLFARSFLEDLRAEVGDNESVGIEVIVEDALILRIESIRLSRKAGKLRCEKKKWKKKTRKSRSKMSRVWS